MENIKTTKTRHSFPTWLLLNVTAMAYTLVHVLVDYQIGLFGESSLTITPLQAAIPGFSS
jgi:hypothetical protein